MEGIIRCMRVGKDAVSRYEMEDFINFISGVKGGGYRVRP